MGDELTPEQILAQQNEIEALLTRHPRLREICLHDANAYAWQHMAWRGKCSVEEMLVGMICWMSDENKRLFSELIDMKMKENPKGILPR